MLFGIVGIIGGILFGITAFRALIRNSGTAKMHLLISGAFVCLFIATIMSSSGSDKEVQEDDSEEDIDVPVESTKDDADEKPNDDQKRNPLGASTKEKTAPEEYDGANSEDEFPESTYRIGKEVEPGEYMVVTKDPDIAYMENSEDSSGDVESIIFNDNFFEMDANAYVTLKDGDYFKIRGMKLYAVEDYELAPKNGKFGDGMYKVGKDIDPGEYKVFLNKGSGFLRVTEDSSYDVFSTVHSESLEEDSKVTVSEGQYLTLQGVYIEVD